jgi:hypothetical protein
MHKKTLKSQKKTLKRQLKRTIAEKHDIKGFKPNVTMAVHWFRRLNRALFNSRLGGVHIEVKKIHADWGRCIANWDNRKTPRGRFDQRVIPYHIPVDYKITLHCKFPTWKDFIETLAHEMVHLYQMTVIKDPYSNHNSNFYAWKKRLSSLGLRLYR